MRLNKDGTPRKKWTRRNPEAIHRAYRTEPRPGTIARKLWDWIESGQQPTFIEVGDYLYPHKAVHTKMVNAYNNILRVRNYYKRNGKLFYSVKTEDGEWRLKILDRVEEIEPRFKRNKNHSRGFYDNILYDENHIQREYPLAKVALATGRRTILELQQYIIGEELKSLGAGQSKPEDVLKLLAPKK